MILRSLATNTDEIEIGQTYRRTGPGPMVETAHILSIAPDRLGIPHVCYELEAECGTAKTVVERRTLGLEAFQMQFSEKVQE